MAGHNNKLEALSFQIEVVVDDHTTEDFVGSIIQKVENALIKPGWSGLRQVSFKLLIGRNKLKRKLCEALKSLPDKYLSHLSLLTKLPQDLIRIPWIYLLCGRYKCNRALLSLSLCVPGSVMSDRITQVTVVKAHSDNNNSISTARKKVRGDRD